VGEKIVSGGVWRVAAYGVSTIVAVASTAVVSRAVGPAGFAEYTTALSLVAVALGISDLGLLALGIREFTNLDGELRERHYRALITLRVLFAVLAALVILVIAVFTDFSHDAFVGLIVASVGLCVVALYASYCVPLQATYQLRSLAILDTSRQVIWSSLVILAAVVASSVGLIVAMLLPAVLVVAMAAGLLARRSVSIRPSWDVEVMRRLLASVGTFAVAASVGAVYAFFAQVASDVVLSAHESGQFALAFRVFAVLLGAGGVAIIGAFPLLVASAEEDLERMVYATRRVFETALITGFACAVGLFVGAEFVVGVIGGANYSEAVELLRIIGFALPSSFVLAAGSYVLLASGRHRQLVAIAVGGAVLSIAATTALAVAYSGRGAAVGIVLGELWISVAYLVAVRKIDSRMAPGKGWFVGVLAVTAAACLIYLLPVPSVVGAGIATLIYLAGLTAFGLLPPELAGRIRNQLPSARS
jgi:O-antigen/teichoic acid export membrane protein